MVIPASWKEQYIDAGEVHVRYHRTGGSKSPIVLLHGITDNGLCWTPVAKALEKEYDVIMPDARGHGKTTTTCSDFSITAMAEDSAKFIEALELRKPIVLGHSMGGQVATLLAARHPDLVSKVILEDPAYSLNVPRLLFPWIRARYLRAVKGTRERSVDEIKASCKAQNPTWNEEELEPWAVAQQETARSIGEGNVRKFDFFTDWRAVFPEVTCPVLLIIPSHGALTLKVTQSILHFFKDARIAFVPDAGHSIRRDQFNRYMAALKFFLDKT